MLQTSSYIIQRLGSVGSGNWVISIGNPQVYESAFWVCVVGEKYGSLMDYPPYLWTYDVVKYK